MSKRVLLFPGQGSQYIGMGKSLFDADKETQELWAKANEVLGYDLSKIVFEGTDEELKDTSVLQPAIFTVSYSVANYLLKNNITIAGVAGHSLGEYSALAVSGAISFEEGLKLTSFRGKVMQEAAKNNPGSMAAVLGMDFEDINAICKEVVTETNKYVAPANFNSPGQIVISGYNESVDKFIELATDKAKKLVKLPVSGAFHSELMNEAATELKGYLATLEIKTPTYPLFFNIDGKESSDVEEIKEKLLKQTTGCVMWVDELKNVAALTDENLLECGPGKVLKGLARQIDRAIKVDSIETIEQINKLLG